MPGVEALNEFFTQVGPALSSKLPNLVYVSTIPRITKTMALNNTTTEKITKIIRNLKTRKALDMMEYPMNFWNAVPQS